MKRKTLQNNWFEMCGQISEGWDDLTDEDLDQISGNPDKLLMILQEEYGDAKNLASVKVKMRMTAYENKGKKNRPNREVRGSEYLYYDSDD
jgi:uncharacterized protein YjbJ (UPF0337 family)